MFLISTLRRVTHMNRAKSGYRAMSNRTSRILAFGILLILISTAAAAQGKTETLVGTWNMTTVIFGEKAYAMVTFFKDGTFIHTAATDNNVNAHGVWKMVAPRTFVEVNREYVYQGGKLALFADTVELIELSQDGMTWTGEAVTELKLLDGTVIDVVTFTIEATRMTIDSDLLEFYSPRGQRD